MSCSCLLLHSCASTHIRPYSTAVRWSVYCLRPPPFEVGPSASKGADPAATLPPRACHPLRFFTFGDPATSPSPPARSVRFSATSHPCGPQVLCPYPACCATRRSSLAAPECGLLLLLLPMDFHYATLCHIASPFSSLPATPPRRHPGKGEGYTELEGVEDDDALLVPIVPSGA